MREFVPYKMGTLKVQNDKIRHHFAQFQVISSIERYDPRCRSASDVEKEKMKLMQKSKNLQFLVWFCYSESSDLKTRSLDTLLLEVETFLHIEHIHQNHNPRHIEMICFVKMNNVKSRQPFEAMPFYAMNWHTLEQSEHNRFQSSFDGMVVFVPQLHKREAQETCSWLFLLLQWVQVLWRIENMLYYLQVPVLWYSSDFLKVMTCDDQKRKLRTKPPYPRFSANSRIAFTPPDLDTRFTTYASFPAYESWDFFTNHCVFVVSTVSSIRTLLWLPSLSSIVTIGVLRSKFASLGLFVLEIQEIPSRDTWTDNFVTHSSWSCLPLVTTPRTGKIRPKSHWCHDRCPLCGVHDVFERILPRSCLFVCVLDRWIVMERYERRITYVVIHHGRGWTSLLRINRIHWSYEYHPTHITMPETISTVLFVQRMVMRKVLSHHHFLRIRVKIFSWWNRIPNSSMSSD